MNENTSDHSQLQQGDVLLSVAKLPDGCKRIEDKRGIVLAEGEHTGHFHGIESDGEVALMEAPDKRRYLVNNTSSPITIRHQEHKPVTVEPGIWAVGQVHEYDWFQQMERRAVD